MMLAISPAFLPPSRRDFFIPTSSTIDLRVQLCCMLTPTGVSQHDDQ